MACMQSTFDPILVGARRPLGLTLPLSNVMPLCLEYKDLMSCTYTPYSLLFEGMITTLVCLLGGSHMLQITQMK